MALWFCAAITTMLRSMAYVIDSVTQTPFGQTSWLPVKGWAFTGGDYTIFMRGDRFVIGERAKVGSLDEISRLTGDGQP